MKNDSTPQKIDRLEAQRAHVNFLYENSPWASGPGYRTQLNQIDTELAQLRKTAA
ncbi:hypothetical protein [Leisingera sp. NJS204]|uniref:hypothetical protein n=1 Tax=Leisingera sp. NJS204 TaxID=2508307 RepID=UPI0013E97888|nr:hypothetical protein [Leisingera sp. NJS204]